MKLRILFACIMLTMASTALALECGADAAAALRQTFPNYSFKEVNPTPIPGIYEVLSDGNPVYFAPESGHLFFGEIWDREGKNIAAGKNGKNSPVHIDSIPLDKAIRIGNGANVVIEVTDPDCPFCRKGSEFFKGRTDVTRYVFFLPLTSIHPEAGAKARYILSAADQVRAYEEVMAGVHDSRPLPSFIDNGLLAEHLRLATLLRVTSTPKYWINGTPVAGADLEQIKSLLRAAGEKETTSSK